MRGHSGVCVSAARASTELWNTKVGDRFPAREVKLKRGGTASQSNSGPTGYKATKKHLLDRAMAERPGVNLIVTARQEANRLAKHAIPRVI